MKVLTKTVGQLGPVRFERRRRMRNINLHVEPYRGVRVSFPYWVAQRDAEQFLAANSDWVRNKLDQYAREFDPQTDLFNAITKDKAKTRLTDRLAELAERHGFTYTRVTVRNQKTRWGSCSVRNSISLNMKLARLPSELSDYVLLHELVHTRVKSHGPIFWNALEAILPGARNLDRQLANHTPATL